MPQFEVDSDTSAADDLRAAFTAHQEEDPGDDDAGTEDADAAAAAAAAAAAESDAGSEPARGTPEGDRYWAHQDRGTDGKFKAADDPAGEETGTRVPAEGEEPGEEGAGAAATGEDEDLGPLEPPTHWPVEQQTLFRSQPEAVQKWMMERDKHVASEYGKKAEALAKEREDVAPMAAMMGEEAFQQSVAYSQMAPVPYLRNLVALSNWANADPSAFIAQFAKNNNINLAQLAGVKPAAAGDPDAEFTFEDDDEDAPKPNVADPAVAQLQASVKDLSQHIVSLKGDSEARLAAEAASTNERTNAGIEAFRDAVDESGAPLHPYFAEVERDMARLIQSEIVPRDLQLAYDKAIVLNDDVRGKVQAADKAATQRARQADRKAKADAARTAGQSITGNAAGASETEPLDSVRAEFERAYYGR